MTPPGIHTEICARIPCGIFVVDGECRIRYWNDWLAAQTSKTQAQVLGLTLEEIFPDRVNRRFNSAVSYAIKTGFPQVMSQALNRYLIPIEIKGTRRHSLTMMQQYVSISSLSTEEKGKYAMVTVQDVTMDVVRSTALRRAQQEKERLIEELRRSLDEIKTLKGLVPICASCKKIRDDKGFWETLETYISSHSEAEFTHGYCPECAAELIEEAGRLK